jgi:hypothetical protein
MAMPIGCNVDPQQGIVALQLDQCWFQGGDIQAAADLSNEGKMEG